MIEKNKNEGMDERNGYELLNNFIEDSKELYNELKSIYKENTDNKNQNIFFKYLSHIQFGLYIVPYLSLKDILNIRQSSKEINLIINSKICCLNYYFKILKSHISIKDNNNNKNKINNDKSSNQLRPLEEMNEEYEFLQQKNILNEIKAYIKSPQFSLKTLCKIYKVELDYLKYEERHQDRYMKALIGIRNKLNNEYKTIQNKEINENKIMDKKDINTLEIDELKKKIKDLKLKKENLLYKMNKEKKINDELIDKNNNKMKIINRLKNIYLNENNVEDNEEDEIDNLNDLNKFI